jgi:calcium-independent phospholipase A2-gamma
MKVFLFRNYNLPPLAQSHYDGTARHKCWEAIRASSAAPGYYEDFKLDGYVFHVRSRDLVNHGTS